MYCFQIFPGEMTLHDSICGGRKFQFHKHLFSCLKFASKRWMQLGLLEFLHEFGSVFKGKSAKTSKN